MLKLPRTSPHYRALRRNRAEIETSCERRFHTGSQPNQARLIMKALRLLYLIVLTLKSDEEPTFHLALLT